MTLMQIVGAALVLVAAGILVGLAWIGREWNVDRWEYKDRNGVPFGKMDW